tara:strand:+ start:7075 stop:7344 length:270 start_codon:yes stop_codon:yes gene_type:complete
MKKIKIYSSLICPYCNMAKKIFQDRNLTYYEILIDNNIDLRKEMENQTKGKKTVPQIFFDNDLIGGFDDLYDLVQKGLLNTKLGIDDEI